MMNPMRPKLQIFQSFHKPYPRAVSCPWITPIRVGRFAADPAQTDSPAQTDAPVQTEGAALTAGALQKAGVLQSAGDFGQSLSDASGDSINALNPHYCELTAQYWVWKNLGVPGLPDFVGFYHYRRYLNFLFDSTWQGEFAFSVPIAEGMLAYLSHEAQYERLLQLLTLADVVIPARFVSEQSVEAKYVHHHPAHTWIAFEQAIRRHHPSIAPYLPLFALSNRQTVYNMFVMPWAIFDAYCHDLFAVIDDAFAQCARGYGNYNDRYPGFLAERFLGLWLHAKGLKVIEVPMLMLTDEAGFS